MARLAWQICTWARGKCLTELLLCTGWTAQCAGRRTRSVHKADRGKNGNSLTLQQMTNAAAADCTLLNANSYLCSRDVCNHQWSCCPSCTCSWSWIGELFEAEPRFVVCLRSGKALWRHCRRT